MQSTYETLTTLKTDTSVPHYQKDNVPHTIKRELLPDGDTYLDADLLEKWAKDNGVMHSCLQKGIKAAIIDIRAEFKKRFKDNDGNFIPWTPESGQKQIDAWTWKAVTEKPGGSKNAEKVKKAEETGHLKAGKAMAKAMRDNGLDDNVIETNLTAVYGKAVTKEIMANI